MENKIYLLIHVTGKSPSNYFVETEEFVNFADAKIAMGDAFDKKFAVIDDKYPALSYQYKMQCTFHMDKCAGLPSKTVGSTVIDTDNDYWKIVEVHKNVDKRIVGYQIVSNTKEVVPFGMASFQIFREKKDAEKYISEYNLCGYKIEEIREGEIDVPSYIEPMKRPHKLEIGERVVVMKGYDPYGYGKVSAVKNGTVYVLMEECSEFELDDSTRLTKCCSPFEVFQIVKGKNVNGNIVCYDMYPSINSEYFTPNDSECVSKDDLSDGEPDYENAF